MFQISVIILLNKSKEIILVQKQAKEVTSLLTEERYSIIIEVVNSKKSVKLTELCELLNASVSTVRRDLNALAKMGRIIKVHGGAVAIDDSFTFTEINVEEKSRLFKEEKTAVAGYAASLIDNEDFVFIDAGTTTEKMIDFLPPKNVTFVTNGFIHAKKLAQKGFKVYIPGGEIKLATEAIVGSECVMTLKNYNFTKCFIGTNGISISSGFSTPDLNEARVKTSVIDGSLKAYILADHSKFDKVTSVTFAQLNRADIITDKLFDKRYINYTFIKEVM